MPNVAIVTGANQGLGFALVEGLCEQLGGDALVYVAARDLSRGQAAVRALNERGFSPLPHQLDVTDTESVNAFARHIQEQHGGADIVISNAAARISPGLPPAHQVAQFIDTNNHGTYRMIRAFMPLLRDNARFLVVASSFGTLRNLPAHLHDEFDVATRTLEEIEALMDRYVALVETGQAQAQGWPEWINIPSKVAQVASAKIMARMLQHDAQTKGILINAVCPGLVDTEASRPWFADMSAAQTPRQAARDLIWLATLPAGTIEPYGELVQHRTIIPWQ